MRIWVVPAAISIAMNLLLLFLLFDTAEIGEKSRTAGNGASVKLRAVEKPPEKEAEEKTMVAIAQNPAGKKRKEKPVTASHGAVTRDNGENAANPAVQEKSPDEVGIDMPQQAAQPSSPEFETEKYLNSIRAKIYSHKRYPKTAAMNGIEGETLVSFAVDNNGNVADMEVKKSSGFEILNRAAVEAVKNASPFHPHGFEKTVRIEVPFKFKLNE